MSARPPISALWRGNLIGLFVVIGAIAILLLTDLQGQWFSYRHTVAPEHVVPVGESLTADGQTWQLGSIRHLDRVPNSYGPQLPTGNTLTVVTVERSGTPAETYCAGVITDGRRRWNAQGVAGFSVPLADGAADSCRQTGDLQFTFLLPREAVPTAVDITALNLAIRIRLEL